MKNKIIVFMMADGSVRMISDQIDQAAYHALATRAGGDIARANVLVAEEQQCVLTQ